MCGTVMRGAVAPPGSKATSRQKGMRRNLRDLTLDHRLQSRWPASGRRGAEADDARAGEVRPRHSSDEVAEQNRGTGSGGDGAKGGGRGGRDPAPHAPDTEPGKRVRGRWSAYGRPQGFAVIIRGGRRMRESRTSGSVRADRGNPVPY